MWGVIVSSASDFVVVWFTMRGVKKIGLTVQCIQWNLLRRTKIYFRLDFFLVSTEFYLDAAGFYLQLSERAVSVASKDSAFPRMFGAATDSGIVFVGRNRKQGEKSS